MRKHINSETTNYQDELTEVLVLDDKPVVNSFNGITSDAVARAVAGASGEVPQVTEGDNGKVLKAIYDEGGPAVEWGDAAPAVTVDQTYDATSENAQSGVAVAEAVGTPVNLVQGSGITLTENSGSVTISANAQLPAYSDTDSGKVLQVQADGTLAWVTLS